MLVTFKSKASGNVHMYAEHAKMLLAAIGKSLEPAEAPRGIISAAEVPAALASLKSAVEASKRSNTKNADRSAEKSAEKSGEDGDDAISVGLAQRAFPLIDMLERAAKENADIVWGV